LKRIHKDTEALQLQLVLSMLLQQLKGLQPESSRLAHVSANFDLE